MTKIRNIAVIGTGTIGRSWAALFLTKGLTVHAHDPYPESLTALPRYVEQLWPTLAEGAALRSSWRDHLVIADSLAAAVAPADFVQENGPEDETVKPELIAAIDRCARGTTPIASSSSGLPVTTLQSQCLRPERVLVGHPFNPPHLVPLVEVVASARTSPDVVDAAMGFYHGIGKRPLRVRKEIQGYIANRLQNALFREAVHLVQEEVATVTDVDDALRYGPGLRWALMGPFLTYALGGGEGGMRRYFEIFAQELDFAWRDLGAPVLDDALRKRIIDQTEHMLGCLELEELRSRRDRAIADIVSLAERADILGD